VLKDVEVNRKGKQKKAARQQKPKKKENNWPGVGLYIWHGAIFCK